MRIPRLPGLIPAAVIAGLLIASRIAGAEADSAQAQPYAKVRYPTFADGRLMSVLEADEAEVFDLAEGTPRVVLVNVSIVLYDNSEDTRRSTPSDQPLPVRMTINSDRGYFTRRPAGEGGGGMADFEDIANLEGNVILRQMAPSGPAAAAASLRPSRLPAGVATEIRCQHAQWNNALRKLNGDGDVEFVQEDSRIVGNGFLYLADEESMQDGSGASNIHDWGGIVFIEHNARMEINRAAADGSPDFTEITCRDTASYRLLEREIQFEREVKVRRDGLMIESDILKVILFREEELAEAGPAAAGSPRPGEVKSIIATIGRRGNWVMITGLDKTAAGRETVRYTARGGRADFDFTTNRISLTDTRDNRKPEVTFGASRDRISDLNLDFVFASAPGASGGGTTLESLNASGGGGEVTLGARPDRDGGNGGPAAPTEINYARDMTYSRADHRIRFRGEVFLMQGDLRIRAETLDVNLSPAAEFGGASGSVDAGDAPAGAGLIERIIAETDVRIQAGNREAEAHRAEYEATFHDTAAAGPDPVPGAGADSRRGRFVLKLFGPPQRTPPFPLVRDEFGNQVSGPEITMIRLEKDRDKPLDRDRHSIRAAGGRSNCNFYTTPDAPGEKGKVISITAESGMQYDESTGIAWFEGQVQANSDAPEDSYVLLSDRLIIYFMETQDAAAPEDVMIWLRRVDASGRARLIQDNRVCEANQIIRDFPTMDRDDGDIYLAGETFPDGRPPAMAVYREQIGSELGSMMAAPLIRSSAAGDVIQANGPGQLSMPDIPGGERAQIHFAGNARYESFHGGLASEAKFREGVILRQPSREFTLNAEELDARFLRDAPRDGAESANPDIERIGRLVRTEARVGVKIEHRLPYQGRRTAIGDRAVVEFTPTGNELSLEADRSSGQRRWIMVRDHDGLMLRAPQLEVKEAQGITRASGPGELEIPGNRGGDGLTNVPTRVIYGERGVMVYNELALNIRVTDNVRIVQPGAGNNWRFPGLDGRCDRMEIMLLEPPAAGLGSDAALSRVQKMDAQGGVLLRVYAEPPPDNPDIDWSRRPGTTFFTRGDLGEYFVSEGRIVMSALPGRQPQLLLNTADVGREPYRQRMRADRFILHTDPANSSQRFSFEGQMDSTTLQEGDPFEFAN